MRILRFSIVTIILALYSLPGASAQCPPGDITWVNQKEINEFARNYPFCTELRGHVNIGVSQSSSDIVDLRPLTQIRIIRGHLNIINNPLLIDIHGLDNLDSIGGYLNIFKNNGLVHLDGLGKLKSVNGFLWIIHNKSLRSIKGLDNLTTLNGSLDISYNTKLSSLEGLENIDPQTISTTPAYLLTPIIDVHISGNDQLSEDQLPNIVAFRKSHSAVERFRQMVNRPYAERAVVTDLIYKRLEYLADTVKASQILHEISEIAQSSRDHNLIWESKLLATFYQLINGSAPWNLRIARMQNLADQAGEVENWEIQARALKLIALRYRKDLFDYEKLFKTYHALQQAIEKMDTKDFPDLAQCYMDMGLSHYLFRDYQRAIHFFQKGAIIPITPLNATFVTHCINNLGLCYQKLQMADSADYYFHQILQDTTHHPVGIWKGIASGNLGSNYYLRKEYNRAIPHLLRDIGTAESFEDWGLAAGSLIPLADIRVIQNDLTGAEDAIRRARRYINQSGQTDRLRLLYPVMGKWQAAMGNKDLAAEYIDSTQLAIRAYNDKFNALKLLRARQELNAKELLLQDVNRQKLVLQRNLVVAIVILLFISTAIFIRHRSRISKQRQDIQNLELQNTQVSLFNAQTRLQDLTRKIRENNSLIKHLQQRLGGSNNPELLRELQNTTILTKDDWQQFKLLFRQVYPGFLSSLTLQYPDLTPAEVRILCLRKLGLDNFEMASAQGVSPNGIIVTQYRIRKKLNLDSQDQLEDLVSSIG